MILAGIDIGTNATRLLIADIDETDQRTLHAARVITRLGQDLDRTGVLSPEARERTVRTLGEFAARMARFPVQAAAVVGTSALRRAANAAEFTGEVQERTGLRLSIISGAEEARLTLEGSRRALSGDPGTGNDPLGNAVVADIGGGSTELIVTREGEVRSYASLELGAVYLTERYLAADPPAAGEILSLRHHVSAALDAWEREQVRRHGTPLAETGVLTGTAGTVTTLASMDLRLDRYDPGRINGHRLSRRALNAMVDALGRASLQERRHTAGLERGREDIIFAGAVIAQELMARSGKGVMLVSDWGLREGIVFDLYRRNAVRPTKGL